MGFSEIWTSAGENRNITFTGLKPGNYTLNIRRRESGKITAAKAQLLHIKVLPPWWKSTWAYLLYLLSIAGAIFLLYRFQLKRQLEIQENRQLKELHAFKNRLYTHITHEFRTPLTVIGGMVEQIQKSPQKYLGKGITIIRRNSDNMLNLVNQILDLRKIEVGKVKLKLIQGDIIAYLRYLTESFESLGESQGVKLHFLNQERTLIMDYDKEKMLRIISNLLSNAVKFTPEGGDVYVTVDRQQWKDHKHPHLTAESALLITIKDTGVGVPNEQLPLIFERFYQIGKESLLDRTKRGEGSGIGLSLTKEFIKLMNGTIEVESEVGKGTTFHIILPVKNEAVLVEETIEGRNLTQENDTAKLPADGQGVQASPPGHPSSDRSASSQSQRLANNNPAAANSEATNHLSKPDSALGTLSTLLIIEDNAEVVEYLKMLLEADYQLSIATDGQEGIDKAITEIPDIIISDVMMPKKDGFEVCETLKKDERTSHIPIIILTAKTDDEARIKGLERGADAYLGKPFNQKELAVRLKKLHELRLQLQARYSTLSPPSNNDKGAHSEPPSYTRVEDAFILKLRKIIEKRMKSHKFGIPELCKTLGMSRSQLHLKIKALTDRSTSHFIRGVRLQRAKELLEEGNTSVKEVSNKVGFPDPAYFSRTFTEEFGHSPREFLKE